jgi:hypothetical protein
MRRRIVRRAGWIPGLLRLLLSGSELPLTPLVRPSPAYLPGWTAGDAP